MTHPNVNMYLEMFVDEVANELAICDCEDGNFIHPYGREASDIRIAHTVKKRFDGTRRLSDDDMRAFIFNYWIDFTYDNGLVLNSEFYDEETVESEFLAWIMRNYIWPQAVTRVAAARGIPFDDVCAALKNDTPVA